MVNEEDEDDIRCKAGMTLLYLGEEQNEKGETVRDVRLYKLLIIYINYLYMYYNFFYNDFHFCSFL